MPFSFFHRAPATPSGLAIDFHCHVLPGADHGSDSTETSLRQLTEAAAQGISKLVATPHFYPHRHRVEDFLARREKALGRLRKAALPQNCPNLYLGAEVLLCPGLENLAGLEKLCLQNTDILLLELPFSDITEDHYATVEALADSGKFRIVLAHIDRYPTQVIRRMADLGDIHMQINAEGVCKTYKACAPWLDTDRIVALGSDMHTDQNNYTKLWPAARKKLGTHFDTIMTRTDDLLSQAGAPALSARQEAHV